LDLATLQGKAAGADVAMILDVDGHVTEGVPGFNVFAVRSRQLFCPPDGVLMGITQPEEPSWPTSPGDC
jgi:branched-subunit amino acid aminotransferase/4-amino-4-deoxychorismate lyase